MKSRRLQNSTLGGTTISKRTKRSAFDGGSGVCRLLSFMDDASAGGAKE